MKKLKYIILPILLCAAFMWGLNKYLDKKDTELLGSRNLYMMLHDTQSLIKDKGVFANNYLMKKGYMMIIGSSELSHSTKQHPDYYFNTGRTKHGVITVGRAYTQSLQDATIVGSLNNDIKDKRIVLLVSMQWFMDNNGVTPHHFQTRFAPIQFYRFLDNPKISNSVKARYIKRFNALMGKPGEFKPEALYGKLYLDNSLHARAMKMLLNPYYYFRKSMLALKDKGITLKKLEKMFPNNEVNYNIKGKIDWDKEMKQAEKDAIKRVGNHKEILGGKRYYVDKGYFREYLRGNEKKFKGLYKNVNFKNAKEFDDLKLFLDTCKDLGIRPTIVMLPAMGKFYDYTGIGKNKRDYYFNSLKNVLEPYGFRVIDLQKKQGERYYLRDVMHVGTVGWVDISQQLYNIYER